MAMRGFRGLHILKILAVSGILACMVLLGAACSPRDEGAPGAGNTDVENNETGAEEAGRGPARPPAPVVVAGVERGKIKPTAEYVGSVFYAQVSEVASEVAGKVEEAPYEEGRRVRKGQLLVRLGTELLDAELESTRASYEQALQELEKAERDLKRMEPLFKDEIISESLYEEHLYGARTARKKAEGLKADLERLELQKEKKSIYAPFGGIVVSKVVEEGEWVEAGGTVAVLANDNMVDILVDVPGEKLEYLEPGQEIEVKSAGRTLTGRFMSFVPKGDVATRTFSVKIRLRNTAGLVEGMEARAVLPTAEASEGLLVPRDAVINRFGQDVVFTVKDSTARMVPVTVKGYQGLTAGVEGEGLSEGTQVVVKGNERIMDGQPVAVENGNAGQEAEEKRG